MTVGTAYPSPSSGYTRMEILNPAHWLWMNPLGYSDHMESYYNTGLLDVRFKFTGTKFMILGWRDTNSYSTAIQVFIDGVAAGTYSHILGSRTYDISLYESVELANTEHTVRIYQPAGTGTYYNLSQIDVLGTPLSPPMPFPVKTNLNDMVIGDGISCEYTSLVSGAVGAFAKLGAATKSVISKTASATPDGTFYFIHSGEDYLGRKKLVADRNIQHSISWDTLNTAGIATGSGVKQKIDLTKMDASTYISTDGFTIQQTRTGGYFDAARSNFKKSSGKWYWEIKVDSLNTTGIVAGVCNEVFSLANSGTTDWLDRCSNNQARAYKYNGSSVFFPQGTTVTAPVTGDILAFAMDLDDVNGTLKMYVNNVLQGTMSSNVKLLGNIYIYAGLVNGNTDKITVNLGQKNFVYTPPSGYSAMYSNLFPTNNIYCKLPTGGIITADKDNEWDKILVESTLNGTITAGSANIWNFNTNGYSWTLTTESGVSTSRVIRGYSTAETRGYDTSSVAGTNRFFRPMLIVEEKISSKFLIKDGSTFYKVVGGVREIVTIAGATPTEAEFMNKGMDYLTGITDTNLVGLTAPKIVHFKF